ncbi:MAG: HD domain-containing protein [Clostridia bacterium]|nr:HD domain-containing protein [Clostridia bacterium]
MNATVLIADRDAQTRTELKYILEETYTVLTVDDLQALHQMLITGNGALCAVVVDMSVFENDAEKIHRFVTHPRYTNVPLFVACPFDGIHDLLQLFNAGFPEFVFKPYDRATVLAKIAAASCVQNAGDSVFEEQAPGQSTEEKITHLLGDAIQARNPETGEHIRRVRHLTEMIAKDVQAHYPEYGLTDRDVEDIVSASAMHDIGKIVIPDSILLKPARLTPAEFEIMKTHTTRGCKLLEEARGIWGNAYADLCKDIALCHHERYDGGGYPFGLRGDDIPITAQIVSIADVYDALSSQRVYKPAIMRSEAYRMIMDGECGAFSEKLLASLTRQLENL